MRLRSVLVKVLAAVALSRRLALYVAATFVGALTLVYFGLAGEKRSDELYLFFDRAGEYTVAYDTGFDLNPLQAENFSSTSGWSSLDVTSSSGPPILRTESGAAEFPALETQLAIERAGAVSSSRYAVFRVRDNDDPLLLLTEGLGQDETILARISCRECLVLLSESNGTLRYNVVSSKLEGAHDFFSSSLVRGISISGADMSTCRAPCGVIAIPHDGGVARVAFAEEHEVRMNGLLTPARNISRLIGQTLAVMLMLLSLVTPMIAVAFNLRGEEGSQLKPLFGFVLVSVAVFVWLYAALGTPAASWDHIVGIYSYRADTVNGWYQWLYPIASGVFETLLGTNGLGYINILMLLAVVIMMILITRRSRASLIAVAVGCLLLVVSAMGILGPLHLRRDVTAALIVTAFLLTLYDKEYNCSNRKSTSVHWVAAVSTMTTAMLLRPDTFVVCGGILLVSGLFPRRPDSSRLISFSRAVVVVVIAGACYVSGSALLQFGFDHRSDEQKVLDRQFYTALTFMNGLGAALQNKEVQIDPSCTESLNAALDVQEFRQQWRADSEGYEMGHFNRNLPPGVFAQFVSCSVHEIVKRPLDFLGGRIVTMMGTLGGLEFVKPLRITKQDAHLSQRNDALRYLNQGLYTDDEFNRGKYRDFANKNGHVWLQLLVLMIALLSFRRAPLSAAVAVALFVRLAFLLVAQPITIFWYVFDVFLIGIFLPAMILFERSNNGPFRKP